MNGINICKRLTRISYVSQLNARLSHMTTNRNEKQGFYKYRRVSKKKKALFLIHNMYYHTFFANVRWTKSA